MLNKMNLGYTLYAQYTMLLLILYFSLRSLSLFIHYLLIIHL